MDLINIVKQLGLVPLHTDHDFNVNVKGVIFSDILSDVMAKSHKGELWITNQTHVNVIAIIFFKGLSGVILPGGLQPEPEAEEKALQKKIPVFLTRHTAFEIAGQLYSLGLRKENL